jgi:hypothetical protein
MPSTSPSGTIGKMPPKPRISLPPDVADRKRMRTLVSLDWFQKPFLCWILKTPTRSCRGTGATYSILFNMSTNGDVLFEEAEGLRQNAAADGRDDLLEGDFKALWPGVQHLFHYYLVWSFRIFIMYRRNVSARVYLRDPDDPSALILDTSSTTDLHSFWREKKFVGAVLLVLLNGSAGLSSVEELGTQWI